MTPRRIIPAVVSALLLVPACSGSDDASGEPSGDTTDTTDVAVESDPAGGDASSGDDSSGDDSSADAEPTGESGADEPRITIERSRFGQEEIRVAAGTTVVWENTDPFAHTVTSTDDAPIEFDSGEFGQDETFEFTFDEPGEYAYFCQIHPTMRAVVIVE